MKQLNMVLRECIKNQKAKSSDTGSDIMHNSGVQENCWNLIRNWLNHGQILRIIPPEVYLSFAYFLLCFASFKIFIYFHRSLTLLGFHYRGVPRHFAGHLEEISEIVCRINHRSKSVTNVRLMRGHLIIGPSRGQLKKWIYFTRKTNVGVHVVTYMTRVL